MGARSLSQGGIYRQQPRYGWAHKSRHTQTPQESGKVGLHMDEQGRKPDVLGDGAEMNDDNPGRPNDDGYPLVEADSPEYWRALNDLGRQGRLPERIWRKKDDQPRHDR